MLSLRPLNRVLGYLNQKFGYPIASGVVRAVRVVLYGAAVYVTTYLLANQDVLHVDPIYKLVAVAALMGLDKFLRENQSDLIQ